MPDPSFSLAPADITALEQALTDERPDVRRKAAAILLRHQGTPLAQVARHAGVRSLQTLYNWIEAYRDGGIDGLANKRSSGRPRLATPAYKELLEITTAMEPRGAGIDLDAWTAEALNRFLQDQTGIAISDARFRVLLHDLGYRFTLVRPTLPPGTRKPTTPAEYLALFNTPPGKERRAWQKVTPTT